MRAAFLPNDQAAQPLSIQEMGAHLAPQKLFCGPGRRFPSMDGTVWTNYNRRLRAGYAELGERFAEKTIGLLNKGS